MEVAEITPNFSQGTISTANSPTDLAIQGDGFFIVQGQNGEQNYTRNGTFTTNAENQLVTGTGNRVMGYGINDEVPDRYVAPAAAQIPLGTASVAKATTEATLQGSLPANGTGRHYGLDPADGPAHRREHRPTREHAPGEHRPESQHPGTIEPAISAAPTSIT